MNIEIKLNKTCNVLVKYYMPCASLLMISYHYLKRNTRAEHIALLWCNINTGSCSQRSHNGEIHSVDAINVNILSGEWTFGFRIVLGEIYRRFGGRKMTRGKFLPSFRARYQITPLRLFAICCDDRTAAMVRILMPACL